MGRDDNDNNHFIVCLFRLRIVKVAPALISWQCFDRGWFPFTRVTIFVWTFSTLFCYILSTFTHIFYFSRNKLNVLNLINFVNTLLNITVPESRTRLESNSLVTQALVRKDVARPLLRTLSELVFESD